MVPVRRAMSDDGAYEAGLSRPLLASESEPEESANKSGWLPPSMPATSAAKLLGTLPEGEAATAAAMGKAAAQSWRRPSKPRVAPSSRGAGGWREACATHPSRCHSAPDMDAAQEIKRTFFPEKISVRAFTWQREKPAAKLEKKEKNKPEAFRLLTRLGYHGARLQQHKLNIHRIHHLSQVYALYLRDLFHTLVNLPLSLIALIFIAIYVFSFMILACLFWHINDECGFGMESFTEAFALSVETWLTIGYGINDPSGPYLRNCGKGVALITVQGLTGLVMNAVLVGLVITHVSSGAFRGCTLIFSEKATIREVGGRLYLTIQMCEMRSTQLLEAHVRAYVIRRPVCEAEMPVDAPQVFDLRLQRPDDDHGALLLPVMPSVIVHEIDACSPLGPASDDDPMRTRHWTRPPIRNMDAVIGNRDACWCKTCGESFATAEMLEAHTRYQAEQDALAGATVRPHFWPLPEETEHPSVKASHTTASWRQQVADFLDKEWFEILIILEGVDTMTAATVQARHSYIAEDIAWDCTFAPMFSICKEQGAVIDFTKIDDLVPAPPSLT